MKKYIQIATFLCLTTHFYPQACADNGIQSFFSEMSRDDELNNQANMITLAARFYENVSKAQDMLALIVRKFQEGVFSDYPQIHQQFTQVNNDFDNYPKFSSMTAQDLGLIRKNITEFQNFLNTFKQENQLTSDQFACWQLLQRFNVVMLGDVLHEKYLPFIEGEYAHFFTNQVKKAEVPLTIFSVGSCSMILAVAMKNKIEGEKVLLTGKDVAISLGFGAILAYFNYLIYKY